MDKQNKNSNKKSFSFSNIVPSALFLAIAGFYGFLGGIAIGEQFAKSDSLFIKLLSVAWIFISIYLAMFIQLIIHEGGHYIFGKLGGYQFASFRIGSFMFLRENEKMKCRKFNIVGTGGQCLMIPPESNTYDFPFVLYNLGGTLMNVIASCIFLLAYFLLPNIPYLSNLILIFSLLGFTIALTNGIPMRLSGLDNDGRNIISLRKDREARHSFWIMLHVNGLITRGTRLKDMPKEWFMLPNDADLNNPLICSIAIYGYSREMDCMNFEKADEIAKHILDNTHNIIGVHKNELLCESLFLEIISQNRTEEVNRLYTKQLKKYIKATQSYPSRQRLLYAYELLVEKDSVKATKRLSTFEKVSKTYPHKCEIEGEKEIIAYVRELANR